MPTPWAEQVSPLASPPSDGDGAEGDGLSGKWKQLSGGVRGVVDGVGHFARNVRDTVLSRLGVGSSDVAIGRIDELEEESEEADWWIEDEDDDADEDFDELAGEPWTLRASHEVDDVDANAEERGEDTLDGSASGMGSTRALNALAPVTTPWVAPGDDVLGEGPADFFLFIKDYAWSLRYRISRGLDDDALDTERPLELEWIQLRKPLRHPSELFDAAAVDAFDWAVREPPRHHGFMYSVTEAVGSGVEAVINFFRGRGPRLLIQPNGISLSTQEEDGDDSDDGALADERGRPVTHCWVEVVGLPFFPVLKSIAFFNWRDVVVDWRA